MTAINFDLSGPEIAKQLGYSYTGDMNPIDHDGTFYATRDWKENDYAPCVRFQNYDGMLHVEKGSINRPADLNACYRTCGWRLEDSQVVDDYTGESWEVTDEVEIEAALNHWGAETDRQQDGDCIQHFTEAQQDDEDEVWLAIKDWLEELGDPPPQS